MRFVIRADQPILVAFEPTAAEFELLAGNEVTVQWHGAREDGMVALEAGQLVVQAPTGGYTRAWDSAGTEIYIGPESAPNAR